MVAQLPQRRWSNIAYSGGMTAPTYPVQPNRVQSFPLQGGFGGNSAMARLQEMMQTDEAPVPQMAQQQAQGGGQLVGQVPGGQGPDIIGALGYGLASGDMGAASRLVLAQKAAAREQALQQQQLTSAISWLDQQDPRLGAAARANPAMIDDLMKQATTPREYKEPQIVEIWDEKTGQPRKGYMGPNGFVPVGGVEAEKPEEPQVIEIWDENTGQPRKMLFYPKSKRMEPLGGQKAIADDGISLEVSPDGTTRFATGRRGKPLNESEAKTGELATLALNAHNELTPALEQELTSGWQKAGGMLLGGAGMEGYWQSPAYQIAEQQAKIFINSIARRQSGATVREDEWKDYGQMFIPQPGNTQDVINKKREARQWAVDAMQAGLSTQAIKQFGFDYVLQNKPLPPVQPVQSDGLGNALQGTITIPGSGAQLPYRIVK